MKYKVMFVEDERTLLESLPFVVPWDDLGFEICGMAADFEEAVALARSQHPDLMISDIMLGDDKTGLDLVHQFSILLPRMRSILLTGYDSFSFARDAIGYTVKAYLLKPVKADELQQKVQEVCNELDKEREEEEKRRILHEQMEKAIPFMFDWFTTYAGKADYDRNFGHMPEQAGFVPVVLGFNDQLYTQELYEQFLSVEVFLRQNGHSVNAFYNGNHYALLLRMKSANTLCSSCDLHAFLSQLQEYLEFNGTTRYVLVIGEYGPSLREVKESYQKLVLISEHEGFVGKRKQIFYTDMTPGMQNPIERIQLIGPELRLDIQSGNADHAQKLLQQVFENARRKGASIGTLRSLGYEAFALFNEIKDQFVPESELPSYPAWSKIEGCRSLGELYTCVSETCLEICHYIALEHENRILNALDRIRRSIDRDYAKGISLEKYAEEVYISPAYLSSLFSERFGVTFKTCLTSVRMEAAMKLLSGTNLKVFQVAEQVGYTDARYFSQVFRKHTGDTPLAYREKAHA